MSLGQLEGPELAVLAYPVPPEEATVHGDIHARGKHLGEREGAAEVEEAVGAPELVGDHRAGQDDGLREAAQETSPSPPSCRCRA